jgi:hypothetical protein
MIFPAGTLKSVNSLFGIERDQRVIIKFLWNEGADACQIAARLQAQLAEHAYQIRTIQFLITEIRRGRQELHDEIRSGKPLLDDLDGKLLVIFDKSPFESTRSTSTAERTLVAHSAACNNSNMALAYSFRFSVNHLSIDAESNANETI